VIGDLASSGAIPALEAVMRFAGARQRLIAHNIANMSTPGFIQKDVSVPDFQRSLGKALADRREDQGPLDLRGSGEVVVAADGTMTLNPKTPTGGILFHDRNNRSIEQLMRDNAENMGAFRIASELLRSRMQQLRDAIAERVA
jgi:flagellar basal-body rod protein FlgB